MVRQHIPLHLGAFMVLSAAAATAAQASETISATDGHLHIAFASSGGANLQPDAIDSLAREVGSPGFLQLKAEDSTNPLAPCALLSAVITGAQVNYLFYELINKSLKTPPFGSNIFGKYDWKQVLWGGGLPNDPNTAADALARIAVSRAWGLNAVLNTHIPGQTQARCLEQLTDPQRLENTQNGGMAITLEHKLPTSLFFTSTSKADGDAHLAQLETLEFLAQPASDRSNPLAPCAMLHSMRLGARLNDDWQKIGAGKLQIPDNALLLNYPPEAGQSPLPNESLLKPLADKLRDSAFLRSGSPEAAVVVSRAFGHEIARTRQLTEMLLDASKASQLDCINELKAPSTLRMKLLEQKISLPLR